MTKVAIFGGGVGGLTVAHELVERGFEVHVYEKNDVCGGKARSLEKPLTSNYPPSSPPPPGLPGEHGFRFFPGFYQHLDDTMKRIPLGSLNNVPAAPNGPSAAPITTSTAFDNLVRAKEFAITQEGKDKYVLPPENPHTLGEWINALDNFFGNPGLELAAGEKEILLKKIFRLFVMCRERREQDYECVTWYDYHNPPNALQPLSTQYNKMFVTGFSRAFVAMDATKASTLVGANTLAQFFRVFFNESTMDRVLNAPTNDAWITPWVAYLEHKGVQFHMEEKLTGLSVNAAAPPKITSATIENTQTGATSSVTADYYVAAIPVEVMTNLVQSNQALTPPGSSLAEIHNIEVSWMTGIMFYLGQDVPIVEGHINFADSKWALTGISQPQFWPNDPLTNYDNGNFRGLLSIVISNWTEPGNKVVLKEARHCTEAEIAQETWEQIHQHLSFFIPSLPSATPEYFLDPAIKFNGGMPTNEEPFMTNMACALKYRPDAETDIDNLMLASDYVRTNVDIATMEGANEAGRRAANAIDKKAPSGYPPSGVWDYPEPKSFAELHPIDKWMLDIGAPFWGDSLLP
jgi:uncharacterized protein with NAD-binding domain and iron-sulfur cluster